MIWNGRRGKAHSQEFAQCGYLLAAVHLLDTEILIDFLLGRGEARAFAEMNIIEIEEPEEVYLG